jgi:hypothetical protein
MAVNYLTGPAVAPQGIFEQTECNDQIAKNEMVEVAKSRRIFTDEERDGREFFPFKPAEKAPWVALALNQLRIYF